MLLTLLSLGVENIRLGPVLPAFLTVEAAQVWGECRGGGAVLLTDAAVPGHEEYPAGARTARLPHADVSGAEGRRGLFHGWVGHSTRR